MKKKLKIGLFCGGPSLERGISLNSARSVCDHLHGKEIEIQPLYFDHFKNPYLISRHQLYSNTPSDFDFKLKKSSKPLGKTAFKKFLKSIDLVFPVMHGPFGEDGEIQRWLEKENCPYVGSSAEACKKAFDKFNAHQFIGQEGFFTFPSAVLKSHLKDHRKITENFFKLHKLKRAIVKPATGGSSIGVYSVSNSAEALEKAHEIFSKRVDTRVIIEPFCKGVEFTVIILQNRFGLPVAILPTEMELSYEDHQIFDYRKKYLATRQVNYHCPPRFSNEIIEKIQIQAEQLFTLFGMKDFARFDGWLLPDGNLWFSDFNPISGMEQNSFLFQQSSQIGMSHQDLLKFIVKSACRRNKIHFPQLDLGSKSSSGSKPINVIFGGSSAERQVSVMSGTNVWLKLRKSEKYKPKPYLLDTQHNVWKLPYHMTLNHTVEEIQIACEKAFDSEKRLHFLKEKVINRISPLEGEISQKIELPQKMSLKAFIDSSDFIFTGLHGGIGEDGTLQGMLENKKIPFNGSGQKGSQIGIDKYLTSKLIEPLKREGVYSASKIQVELASLNDFTQSEVKVFWKNTTQRLNSKTLIVKPVGDGCSAGIARLYSAKDLEIYLQHAQNGSEYIPEGLIKNQHGPIEMPPVKMKKILLERFVITDEIKIIKNQLKWKTKTDWIEITMGVYEQNGKLKAMNPSVTVAVGNILTLEEKFQGGTGVNITPPPQPYVKRSAIQKAKQRMEKVAEILNLKGYARIDAFMQVKTGELIIIEANTNPGLTPSTVIYHQALQEKPLMEPTAFLEKIIENGCNRYKTK